MIQLALISPEKAAYSTTFIHAHKELLNAKIKSLYGIFFPEYTHNDTLLVSKNPINGIKQLIYTYIRKKDQNYLKRIALYKYLKENKIQIVLAEFGPTGGEVFNVCKTAGIPLIVHFHGFDAWADSILLEYEARYKFMFNYASYIIVVSKDMEAQLIKLGAPAEKVIYNCYGPRDEFFNVKPQFKAPEFLSVGRFVDKKAPYLTLLAFKAVVDAVPDAKLHMIGDGPLLFTCQNLTQSLGIGHAVNFHGALSHDKVCEIFEQSYAFIQHSIVANNGDSEGTPVAILEASAAGLPIVSTRHAGIKDVVIHEKTGFLVNEKDVAGMSSYMIRLANNRQEAITIGEQGREFVRNNFPMQKHIATLDRLIQSTVINRPQ